MVDCYLCLTATDLSSVIQRGACADITAPPFSAGEGSAVEHCASLGLRRTTSRVFFSYFQRDVCELTHNPEWDDVGVRRQGTGAAVKKKKKKNKWCHSTHLELNNRSDGSSVSRRRCQGNYKRHQRSSSSQRGLICLQTCSTPASGSRADSSGLPGSFKSRLLHHNSEQQTACLWGGAGGGG